jgi:hypothetical protein
MFTRAHAFASLAALMSLQAADRPQFGEAWSRNMTSPEVNLPATFNPTNGTHIRWSVPLGASGTESHSTPVVAQWLTEAADKKFQVVASPLAIAPKNP